MIGAVHPHNSTMIFDQTRKLDKSGGSTAFPGVNKRKNSNHNSLNWKNPLQEFGMKEAYESTIFNGQKRVKTSSQVKVAT